MTTDSTSPLNSDEKLWVIFSHLSVLIGVGIILPLVVYLVKKGDSPRVAGHAREALNFHISLFIYVGICAALFFLVVPPFLIPLIGLFGLVFSIVAAVKSLNGQDYRYPLTLRLVK